MKHEALTESKREKIRDRKGGLLKGRPPELGYLSRISEGRQQGYRIPRWQKFEGWRWEQTKQRQRSGAVTQTGAQVTEVTQVVDFEPCVVYTEYTSAS